MFIALLVVFIVLFLLVGYSPYLKARLLYGSKLPPGPMPLPFIGNILPLSRDTNLRMWEYIYKLGKQYGPLMTFYLGRNRIVVVNDPKMIQEVFVKNGEVFNGRPTDFGPHIGGNFGIVFKTGNLWRQRRRFGMKAMRDFGMGKEAMVEKIHEELGFFLAEVERLEDKPFNPRLLIANAVANIICSLVFTKRFNYGDEDFKGMVRVISEFTSIIPGANVTHIFLPEIGYFVPSIDVRVFNKSCEFTSKLVNKAINECRQDFDPENVRGFPDLFIQMERCPKPDDHPIDLESFLLVMTDLFLAGSETTSTWLAWTMLYFGVHQDVQRKCHDVCFSVKLNLFHTFSTFYQEIDELYGNDPRFPSLKDRSNLIYVDAVAHEILRHCTIVPMNPFHSNPEKSLSIAGCELPKNTIGAVMIAAQHFDSSYWTEPEKFDPQRWLTTDEKTGAQKLLSHSSHFMPFGLGARICLGENLAWTEWFNFTVSLLKRYRIELAPGYEHLLTKDGKDVDIRKSNNGLINCPGDYEIKLIPRF